MKISDQPISGAFVVFVKTPKLSPVKTRLAAEIGQDLALNFYQLAVDAMKALMKKLSEHNLGMTCYFAVAEKEGLNSEHWRGFSTVWQGEGGLGIRLSTVYSFLKVNHNFVTFMGADSPHIEFMVLEKAISLTRATYAQSFTIGETQDGGFYFFGGGCEIPTSCWENVAYSTARTAAELRASFERIGKFQELPRNFDIDRFDDLKIYKQTQFSQMKFLPEQDELIRWARSVI